MMDKLTFYRIQGVVYAYEHDAGESADMPIKPLSECSQYSRYNRLYDAVERDLAKQLDGKYCFNTRTGEWTFENMSDFELVLAACAYLDVPVNDMISAMGE